MRVAVPRRVGPQGVVRLVVRCPPGVGECAGRLTLKAAARRIGTLGAKRFRVLAGHAVTVRLRLSRPDRATLARLRRLRARATLRLDGGLGTLVRRVTLRAPVS
jgi:hypothetical protein